jgi:hypothetical protein
VIFDPIFFLPRQDIELKSQQKWKLVQLPPANTCSQQNELSAFGTWYWFLLQLLWAHGNFEFEQQSAVVTKQTPEGFEGWYLSGTRVSFLNPQFNCIVCLFDHIS